MEYGPIYDAYYWGLLQGLQHDTIGPAFTNRLAWLNTQGMEMLSRNQTSTTSPKKVPVVFIPSASEVAAYETRPSPTLLYGAPSNSQELSLYPAHTSTFTYDHVASEAGPSTGEYSWGGSVDNVSDQSYYRM